MQRPPILYALLVAAILVAAAGLFADIKNTARYGGVDLRNRVTAARVATELHRDPYTFKWTLELPDRYLDPGDNITIPFSRVTVPPTVLLLHASFSYLPYRAERWIWFVLQWALLLGTIYLLSRRAETREGKVAIWILGLLFISGSYFWRLHVERGQIYVLYAFLFALALELFVRKKISWSGIVLGALTALRPPFLLVAIPFLLAKQWRMLASIAVGGAVSIALTLTLMPLSLWGSYYQSVKFQGDMRTLPETNFASPGVDVAEGMNIRDFLGVPGEDSSLQRIIRALFDTWLRGSGLFALLLVTLLPLLLLMRYQGPANGTAQSLFFVGIFLTLISEFFIPAPRWPYADVIWLVPLALVIVALERGNMTRWLLAAGALAVTGLLLNVGFHLIPYGTLIGEALVMLALLIFFSRSRISETV